MNEFANRLIETLLRKVVEIKGNGFITRQITRGVREAIAEHPDVMPAAINETLIACNLELKPKG